MAKGWELIKWLKKNEKKNDNNPKWYQDKVNYCSYCIDCGFEK